MGGSTGKPEFEWEARFLIWGYPWVGGPEFGYPDPGGGCPPGCGIIPGCGPPGNPGWGIDAFEEGGGGPPGAGGPLKFGGPLCCEGWENDLSSMWFGGVWIWKILEYICNYFSWNQINY